MSAATFKSEQDVGEFLDLLRAKAGQAYTVDVFLHEINRSQGDWRLFPYLLWGMVHVFTLGLVPIWKPTHSSLYATIRDRTGRVFSKLKVANSASVWIWAPFIFRSDAKRPSEAVQKSAYFKNTVRTMASKIGETLDRSKQ